jgi:hypothetical protein
MTILEAIVQLVGQAVTLCAAGVAACAWPLTLVIIILAFRKQIPPALSRISELVFPGGRIVFGWGDASVDQATGPKLHEQEAEAAEQVSAYGPNAEEGIRWQNTANLFWLGRDLMWTMDMLLRGAPGDQIRDGLAQSLHHVKSMRFARSSTGAQIESQLAQLKAEADDIHEWTPDKRDWFTRQLFSITGRAGALASANQPDYKPRP